MRRRLARRPPDGRRANTSIGYGTNNNADVVGTFVAGPPYTSRAFLSRNGAFSDLNRLVPTGTRPEGGASHQRFGLDRG